MIRCEIILYGMLGMYEEAVSVGMAKDQIDLAKIYANKPVSLPQRKALWLKIASQIMKNNPDSTDEIKTLMKEGGVLKIEDLIPQFDE